MVDFRKRAAKAGDGVLHEGETVLAAMNFTPAPFEMLGTAAMGGAIAGGLVGAAVGAAVDKHREKKAAEEDAAALVPSLAGRPPGPESLPKNGALVAVTERRLLAWSISGLGKPKEVAFEVPLTRIDAVVWHDADRKFLRGSPKSTLFWIGLDGETVLPGAAISQGPAGKYVRGVIEALEAALPGHVREFTG